MKTSDAHVAEPCWNTCSLGSGIGPDNLLSFEEVRRKLKAQGAIPRSVQDIPLAAVVGSVGRYADFNRHFLPLHDEDQARWTQIREAMLNFQGVPPIDVYQLGAVYFVKDGNHRVSVAHELGITHIEAHVTEVPSRVALTLDTSPDDLIIASEYADFLQQTDLDKLRPTAILHVTAPGQYTAVASHIEIQRYRSGFRDLVQRCPQPVLAVPGDVSPLVRGLIAFDGSPRAEDALIIAAYLALRWDVALAIVTALEEGAVQLEAQARAREYMQRRGVTASFVVEEPPVAQAILTTAEMHGANMIIMGGYGLRPELEIVLGSIVDHVLRASHMPVLICR